MPNSPKRKQRPWLQGSQQNSKERLVRNKFYNRTRVWTDEDQQRIVTKIVGKSKGDAAAFIRDTEDCKKKDADKLLALMEDNGTIHWEGKRPKFVALGKDNKGIDL